MQIAEERSPLFGRVRVSGSEYKILFGLGFVSCYFLLTELCALGFELANFS